MAVTINSSGGYFRLDSWVLANIIQLGTQSFCDRFVTYEVDPGRRMFDQMTLAARSVPANIAEGASRHDTSIETEMRLTDVARASLCELQGDYFNFILRQGVKKSNLSKDSNRSKDSNPSTPSTPSIPSMASTQNLIWSVDTPELVALRAIRLDTPVYTNDLLREAGNHILLQKTKFDPFIENDDMTVCANALMFLCYRLTGLLKRQLASQLERFKAEGGFTENMTDSRLQAKRVVNEQTGAPYCPQCGAIMQRQMAKKGINAGHEFWSCTNYRKTGCRGTRPI